ncbi:MAG: cell division protein FtsH, partial [Planctomycetota bacterium]
MFKRHFLKISLPFLFFMSILAIHHSAHAAFPVTERIPYSDFKKLVQEDKLEEVILDSLTIKGIL